MCFDAKKHGHCFYQMTSSRLPTHFTISRCIIEFDKTTPITEYHARAKAHLRRTPPADPL